MLKVEKEHIRNLADVTSIKIVPNDQRLKYVMKQMRKYPKSHNIKMISNIALLDKKIRKNKIYQKTA